ncbi:S41 family peptidase [Olivibacter sitiensis]|uniref:S41 family peptidase n=1 Tax=Olivibacter sitiensis TaxID=376470 RepID=UPI0004061258|nr:S41 family peptidase [Olivibacter sitiensis]
MIKFYNALVLLAFGLVLISCSKDEDNNDVDSANSLVNRWMVDSMRIYYYWNNQVPGNASLDFDKDPEDFFEDLLSDDDRFSYIGNADEMESSSSGISRTAGLSIGLVRLSASSNDVLAFVRYVLKDSPAYQQGLRRGDIILKFNEVSLSVSNYNTVLSSSYYGNDPYTVVTGRIENNTIYEDKTITLTPVQFTEQAVHQAQVLETNSGRKVGYMFYNQFIANQASQLVDSIAKLKNAGIEDLILDLRYNPGGFVSTAGMLCGLIQNNFDENSQFLQYVFNGNFGNEVASYLQTIGSGNIAAVKSNNLNLNRVFILATNNSASASELVINNLRPFLGDANVIHIGKTTVGKNEGSFLIKDRRTPRQIEWGIQPIVLKIANSNGYGDYPNGLSPTYDVDEWDVLPFVELGSASDPLVAKALSLIDPSMASAATSSKVMSIRSRTTSERLSLTPLEDFEDKSRVALPLDVSELFEHGAVLK